MRVTRYCLTLALSGHLVHPGNLQHLLHKLDVRMKNGISIYIKALYENCPRRSLTRKPIARYDVR